MLGELATADEPRSTIGPTSSCGLLQEPCRSRDWFTLVSEYGAAIWADPFKWIPEAARLLRVGGELVSLANSLLFVLWAPDEDAAAGAGLVCDRRVYPGWSTPMIPVSSSTYRTARCFASCGRTASTSST